MRAVAYCRVSTDELEQRNSLKNQIDYYNERFSQDGYEKVDIGVFYNKAGQATKMDNGIFADEGITGTKKTKRKAFQYLLECAENKMFDVIYCKNVPRFSRNVEDGAGILKRLKQLGIKVIFEEGALDSSNKSHEFIINQLFGLAQQESQSKSESVKWGIRKAQKGGKWTSNCPFGYDRVKGFLVVNPKEAEVVLNIFDWYVNYGWGHNKILRYLNNNNIFTKKGGMWYQQHIKSILASELYIGHQITHKTENMDVNIIIIDDIEESDWINHSKEELIIIDESTWKQAKIIGKKRSEDSKSKRKHSDVNVFSTVCRCDNCGGAMRRKKKKTKLQQKTVNLDSYEWVCQNNDMFGKTACKYRNAVDEEVLFKFAKERIQGYREHTELLEQSFHKYLYAYHDVDTVKELIEIEEKISELNNERRNHIRLNTKGSISDEEFDKYTKEYRKDSNDFTNRRIKLINITKEIEEAKVKYQNFIKYLNNVNIENLTNVELKKIFSSIQIGTYAHWRNTNNSVVDYDNWYTWENIDRLPYSWLNKKDKTIKHIYAELNFIDKNEMDIYEEVVDKDWNKLMGTGEFTPSEMIIEEYEDPDLDSPFR